ncbi:hypothetical protein Tco_0996106 [Tanacetum coccineum]
MQQSWYTVKKAKDTKSYEFLLASKKCVVDVKVFQKILDICPRVQGVYFAELPDDETTLAFLLNLGYKGSLHKHLSMYGMFYWENVDYPELIWKDFAFQIYYKKLKKVRCENMPYPRFTKIIINHFLSKHQSPTKLQYLHTHIIKDDGVAIKQSESYQMFIKYFTGQIPPKKSRGKGSDVFQKL